jgi:hypothetical protein
MGRAATTIDLENALKSKAIEKERFVGLTNPIPKVLEA